MARTHGRLHSGLSRRIWILACCAAVLAALLVPGASVARAAAPTGTADLTIRETVTGTGAPSDAAFSFRVTLRKPNGEPRTGSFSYTYSTGGTGTLTLDASGTGVISGVAAGGTVAIHGIPAGDSYEVTETAVTAGGVTADLSGALSWTTVWNDREKLILPIISQTPQPVSGYAKWQSAVRSYLGANSSVRITDLPVIRAGTTVSALRMTGTAPNPSTDTNAAAAIAQILPSITVNADGSLSLTSSRLFTLTGNSAYTSLFSSLYLYIDYGLPTISGRTSTGMVYAGSGVNFTNTYAYVPDPANADRRLDGTVWYDGNENGMIDAGEQTLEGLTVRLQTTADGGATWTDAADRAGAPLTAMTGAAGRYTFRSIPSGQYRVLAEVPHGSRIVRVRSSALPAEVVTDDGAGNAGMQGSADNDALPDPVTDADGAEWAVIQTLDKTGQTPAADVYYTHNADFAFVPAAELHKSSEILSTGSTDPGTAEQPADVLYGDTIRYSLTVANGGAADIQDGILTVTDELPDGLTYVSSQVPDPETFEMTAANPAVEGQRLTWGNLPAVWAGASYTITVTARVTKPNVRLVNTAHTVEPDGTDTPSNTTYHASRGLSLTLTKTVAGTFADPQKQFAFTVSLGSLQQNDFADLQVLSSPYTGSAAAGATTPDSGTIGYFADSTIRLKSGQSITIRDLPMGMRYRVTEAGSAGYSQTVSITNETANAGTPNTGSDSAAGGTAEGQLNSSDAAAAFVNTYLAGTGDVTLQKTVTGARAPESARFNFSVTVKKADGTPRTGAFSYDGSGGTGGTLTLDAAGTGVISGVAAGETVTLHGLTIGDTYTMTEISAAVNGTTAALSGENPWTTTWKNTQKLIISINGATPAPVSGYGMWMRAVNSYIDPSRVISGVTVTETVDDIPAFSAGTAVRIMRMAGSAPDPAADTDVTATVGPQLVSPSVNEDGSLTLTAGSIFPLVNNTAYREIIGQFYLYLDDSAAVNSGRTAEGMVAPGSGAAFLNAYTPAPAALTVLKMVRGELADPAKLFTFRLDLATAAGAADAAGYSYMIYTMAGSDPAPASDAAVAADGTIVSGGTFRLKHRQYIVVSGLPDGERYTVTEEDGTDYSTSVTAQNGLQADAPVNGKTAGLKEITGAAGAVNRQNFTNTKGDVPPTGIVLEFWPYLLAALLALGAGIGLILRGVRKKKRAGGRAERKNSRRGGYKGL